MHFIKINKNVELSLLSKKVGFIIEYIGIKITPILLSYI